MSTSPVASNKRAHKHLNYIPWEPNRAAVSRVEQSKSARNIPDQSISTQLYRYHNSSKPPSPPPPIGKVKPTATVEPFQAPINVDDILYGAR